MIRYFVTFILFVLSMSVDAAILFYSGFETGLNHQTGGGTCVDCWDTTKRSCNKAWSHNVVNSGQRFNSSDDAFVPPQARAGNKMLRLEIRHEDTCSNVNFNHRNEMVNTNVMDLGSEYWIGFSIYLPVGRYPTSGPACEHHGYHNQTKSAPGAQVVVTGESLNPRGDGPFTPYSWWYGNAVGKFGKQKYNQWTDMVYHVIYRQGSDGLVEVWDSGVKIGQKSGSTIVPSTFGTLPVGSDLDFRLSQYVSPDCSPGQIMINYFDEVRIGNAASSYAEVSPGQAPPPQVFACSDGIDNDSDGLIDYPADSGCESTSDQDESNQFQCSDGLDNDSDGLIDYPTDTGCVNSSDDNESDPPECSDEIDNDGDCLIDYPAEPGCSSASDNDETDQITQCSDGLDNDSNGFIDYPADPGCSSASDNSEESTQEVQPHTLFDFYINSQYDWGFVYLPVSEGCKINAGLLSFGNESEFTEAKGHPIYDDECEQYTLNSNISLNKIELCKSLNPCIRPTFKQGGTGVCTGAACPSIAP